MGLPLLSMRITPAWAGKSSAELYAMAAFWDHPRVGGEKQYLSSKVLGILGSPPRGRGKARAVVVNCAEVGITPAWAGKSLCNVSNGFCAGDHPRVGGEKAALLNRRPTRRGSPPRGRGKGRCRFHRTVPCRITPAWAGKRQPSFWPCAGRWDHPRVGGEKAQNNKKVKSSLGSPPRGRGKAAIERVWKQWLGITPAWAGKSFSITARGRVRRDHPRVGGEKGNR